MDYGLGAQVTITWCADLHSLKVILLNGHTKRALILPVIVKAIGPEKENQCVL